MTCLSMFPPFLFVGIVFSIIIGYPFVLKHKHFKLFAEVANELPDGEAIAGGWRDRPKVIFRHAHGQGVMTFDNSGGKNKTYWVNCTLHSEQPMPNIQMRPEGFFSELFVSMGFQKDIQVGDSAFDSQFIIRGSPEAAVKRLLMNTHVQGQLLNLDDSFRILKLGNRGFTVMRTRWFKRAPETVEYVRRCMECYESLVSAQHEPYEAVARSKGLQLIRLSEPNGYRFRGEIGACSIDARYSTSDGGLALTIDFSVHDESVTDEFEFDDEFESTTHQLAISHKDHDEQHRGLQSVDLKNPVLDHMIKVSTNHDPQGLSRLLNEPGIAEAILPIVHAHPGSRITANQIVLLGKGLDAEKVGESIDEMVHAVQTFQGPLQGWKTGH